MATAVKTPNYTPEQTKQAVGAYKETPTKETVEKLAELLGKTTRSIIAKLSKEGVYQAKEYKTKAGEAPVKKDETADAIGKVLRLSDGEVDSLTKANKTALRKVFDALANSVPITDADRATHEERNQRASMIGVVLDLDEAETASLARASATALDKVFAALQQNSDASADEEDPDDTADEEDPEE